MDYQSLTFPITAFFIALSARALFSFLETSITALRLFKLKELATKTAGRYEYLFQTLEKQPQRVLITILIANSLADVTTAALATHIMETVLGALQFSSGFGFSMGIVLATIAILLFGEIIPKNVAKGRSERLFKSTLWIINMLFYLFYPIVTLLTLFSDALMAVLGGRNAEARSEWISSEKEIRFLIDYIYEQGLIEAEKSEMLQNIFDLGRTPVREIMVPATDIVSVDVHSTIKATLAIFNKFSYTRLPVYEGKIDNIVGMVHLKDIFNILSRGQDKPLQELLRTIIFIPENVKVNQLLREFRHQHMHIAMVINEHGSIIGLITLEDVLEEIVGEISDEHEPNAEKIVELKPGGWLADGSTPLDELAKVLAIAFETEDSLTLGGFLIEQFQHLPQKGERLLYKHYYFQVQKASNKRVLQVLIFEEKQLSNIKAEEEKIQKP